MPLSLIKRLVKGLKLTPQEEDNNKTAIENAVNGFDATLNASLNPDGTLKNNTVSTASIQDRAVTLSKLAFLSNFFAQDSGGANAIVISFTPPLTAYVVGLLFWVKVNANNSGATTMNVDGLGATPVKKYTFDTGLSDLATKELIGGNVYAMFYDGTRFLVLNPTPPPAAASSAPVPMAPANVYAAVDAAASVTWATFDGGANGIPVGAKAVQLFAKTQVTSAATDGEVTVQVRANAGSSVYTAGYSAGVHGVASGSGQFGIYPIDPATRKFDIQVVQTTMSTVEVLMVGYFS